MPPRHAYWTIILEGKPTAFRSHTREELAPTFRQLQARHPDAVMMWFARGRLWQSPEHQRDEALRKPRDGERRGPGWRPGGAHKDPRERFRIPRDEKRRRFAERLRRDRVEPRADGGEGPRRPDHPERRPDWKSEKRPPRRPGPGPGERPPWRRDEPDRPKPDRPKPDRPREERAERREQRSERRPFSQQKPGGGDGGGFRKPGGGDRGRKPGARPGGGRGVGGRGGPRGGGRGGRGGPSR